ERTGIARRDGPVRAEHRLELADLLVGGAGARAVSGVDDGAVRQRHRADLTGEEAAVDGRLGAVLALHTPAVLVFAADAGVLRHVLGGLTHRDVDVGDVAVLARVMPLVGALGLLGG